MICTLHDIINYINLKTGITKDVKRASDRWSKMEKNYFDIERLVLFVNRVFNLSIKTMRAKKALWVRFEDILSHRMQIM